MDGARPVEEFPGVNFSMLFVDSFGFDRSNWHLKRDEGDWILYPGGHECPVPTNLYNANA